MAKKLFIGSLSWGTTSASLGDFFASAGQVVSADVITDKMTGRSKGFGFVEMATEEAAQEALKLNGQMLDGRAIIVNEARPQEPRTGFGGGSSGGYGNRRPGGNDRRDDHRGGNSRGGQHSGGGGRWH